MDTNQCWFIEEIFTVFNYACVTIKVNIDTGKIFSAVQRRMLKIYLCNGWKRHVWMGHAWVLNVYTCKNQ